MQPEELKQLRTACGMSQKEFGAAIGLSSVFIGMMERGEKAIELRTALAARQVAADQARAADPKALERAARALCELAGNPPGATMGGRPLWQDYLPEVRAVLNALGLPTN